MGQEKQNELRRELLTQRQRVIARIYDNRQRLIENSKQLLQSPNEDLGNNSIPEFDPELEASLLEDNDRQLCQIDVALERLERGEYGLCFDCGEEIEEKRLKALPFAVRCRECQEVAESRKRMARGRF